MPKFLLTVFAALIAVALSALLIAPASGQSVTGSGGGDTESETDGESPGLVTGRELTEREKVYHLLCRFSPGPDRDLLEHVLEIGIEAWLDRQLLAIDEEPEILLAKLEERPSYFMTNQEIMQEYIMRLPPNPTIEQIREANRLRNTPRRELKEAVMLNAVYSNNHVLEVAADFYRQHFAIELSKGNVRYFGMEYEREVIRGLALGSFPDILEASAKHPAMLFFLDNYLSRRPPTKEELAAIEARTRARGGNQQAVDQARDIARQRGLNENYARELLELHTLGVDRFYTQNDVIEVAKALTGWTYNNNRDRPVVFQFRESMHASGNKRLLGQTIRENKKDPVKEGEEVLRILTEHKGTSYFLAEKLIRHLVNDNPSKGMIRRIANVWRDCDGHMPTVLKAIAMDREFNHSDNYQSKYKRPYEFVVSALRATDADVQSTGSLQYYLSRMREELYECPDPTGYYDQAEAWNDAGAIATRWKFCVDLALGKVRGIKLPDSLYSSLNPRLPRTWKDPLIEQIMPLGLSDRTEEKIDMLVDTYLERRPRPRVKELAPIIVAAILGSPDFQRQ